RLFRRVRSYHNEWCMNSPPIRAAGAPQGANSRRLATGGSERSERGAPPVIAVDGPAASGKGTVAAGVARALGFHLLDSGSLYRLVALKALTDRIAVDNEAALAATAKS